MESQENEMPPIPPYRVDIGQVKHTLEGKGGKGRAKIKKEKKKEKKRREKIETLCGKVRYKFLIPAFKGDFFSSSPLPTHQPSLVHRSAYTHSFVRSIVQLPSPLPLHLPPL